MYAFTALHFIVGDVFAESHTCWYVLFIVWFLSRCFLSSFLNYFLACWLFKSVFNLHILVDFPTFPSTINFISLHCDRKKFLCTIWVYYSRLIFWPNIWSILENVPLHLWKGWNLSLSGSHSALAARFLGVTSHCRARLLGRSAISVH